MLQPLTLVQAERMKNKGNNVWVKPKDDAAAADATGSIASSQSSQVQAISCYYYLIIERIIHMKLVTFNISTLTT